MGALLVAVFHRNGGRGGCYRDRWRTLVLPQSTGWDAGADLELLLVASRLGSHVPTHARIVENGLNSV